MKPYVRTRASSVGPVFQVLIVVAIIGLVLSLRGDAYSPRKKNQGPPNIQSYPVAGDRGDPFQWEQIRIYF